MNVVIKKLIFPLIFSLSGIIALTVWFFYHDLDDDQIIPKQTVAYLVDSSSDVFKLKAPTRGVPWTGARTFLTQGEKIYRTESVQTDEDSTATIRLVNSAMIDLDPYSSLNFDMNDYISLSLSTGGLYYRGTTETKKEVYLGFPALPDISIDLRNSEFNVFYDSSAPKSSWLRYGDREYPPLVITVNGDKFEMFVGNQLVSIPKGSVGNLTNSGFKQLRNRIKLTTLQRQVFLKPKEPMTIRWIPIKGNYRYILETSVARRGFKKSREVSGPMISKISFKPPGRTFKWRIKAFPRTANLQKLQSPEMFARVQRITRPSLFSPDNGQQFFLSESPRIGFRFKAQNYLETPKLEIASDRRFKNILAAIPVTRKVLHQQSWNKPGKYYWRIKGFLRQRKMFVSSPASSFSVLRQKPIFRFVDLKYPYPSEVITASNARRGVVLGWEQMNGANGYEIKVEGWYNARNREKGRDADWNLTTTSKSDRYTLTNLRPGLYTWTIRALGTKANPSENRIFFVGKSRLTNITRRVPTAATKVSASSSKSSSKSLKKRRVKDKVRTKKKPKIEAPAIQIKVE